MRPRPKLTYITVFPKASPLLLNAHRDFHALFRDYRLEKIAELVNKIWLPPDVVLVIQKRDNI